MKFDYHVHSTFSPDAKSTMDEMCQRAIELGIDGIAFTDHVDVDIAYSGGGTFVIRDVDEYNRAVKAAQQKYKGRLTILKGLEIGYSKEEWAEAQQYIADVKPDYIIGSLHVVDHVDPYEARFFDGFDRIGAFTHYITALIESIDHFKGKVDVIGHLNYVSKYAPYEPREFMYGDTPQLWDELLTKIIDGGLGIEINTSGIDKCGAPLPGYDVLKRYYELGGHKLVFGSDAHITKNLFKYYDRALTMIKEIGFDGFTDYTKGQR